VRGKEMGVGPGSTTRARRALERENAMKRRMQRIVGAAAFAAALGISWGMDFVGGGDIVIDRMQQDERDALFAEVAKVQAEVAVARDLTTLHDAVAAFADVEQATAAGYGPSSDCMAGSLGAQGIHYAKEVLFEPSVVLETPQLLMYEPRADGSLRFIGVEYLVFQQAWHDAGHVGRPTLLGQTFGLNETLLDEPFYLLHVWIGQFNPSGLFANWNPLVACGDAAAGDHGVVLGILP
jgi:hypothetical protein